MSLMLVALFASVGVGVLVKQFGRREMTICLAIAAGLVVAYFLHPTSMT